VLFYGKININSFEVNTLFVTVLITIVISLAVFASVAAWFNTQIILRDLSKIKKELGVKEEKKPSFLDRDLDND
jgi:hypothetical protein